MGTVIFNGLTYEVDGGEADAIREMATQLTRGERTGFLASVTRDGHWHRLFVTAGCPLTLVD